MECADAHMHIADCVGWRLPPDTVVCSSAHSWEEFQLVEAAAQEHPGRVMATFGIHPQNPRRDLYPVLEQLAGEGRIQAVGEAGFDLFTPELAAGLPQQLEVWHLQLELAKKYQLPLVVHCRKAMDKVFMYTKELKALPAVVFHAYPGSPQEARNLLRHGVNAYFSFGKELIRGRRNSIQCVESLPLERLLAETDAPYQTLHHQAATPPEDIELVYGEFAKICGVGEVGLKAQLLSNFFSLFHSGAKEG